MSKVDGFGNRSLPMTSDGRTNLPARPESGRAGQPQVGEAFAPDLPQIQTPVGQPIPVGRGTPADQSPIGLPGELGQPRGLPAPSDATGKSALLPDAVIGRDPSQLVAAERLRSAGAASATEQLLGLNQQPSVLGAFPPPPGNIEALRHLTPAMRRTAVRDLLMKQRRQTSALASALRRARAFDDDEDEQAKHERNRRQAEATLEEALAEPSLSMTHHRRASVELKSAVEMLDVINEFLEMQDYALSQMGTFSHG
jgi:hypothetical protein